MLKEEEKTEQILCVRCESKNMNKNSKEIGLFIGNIVCTVFYGNVKE